MTAPTAPLLEVAGLTLGIPTLGRTVVHDVGFTLEAGEIVGIVGESGSGKTMVARAVIGLSPPPIRVAAGRIRFQGEEVTTMHPRRLRALRGSRIGMVFQEPMTSLNPSMRLSEQLDEGLALHTRLQPADRRAAIVEMLRRVGLTDPERTLAAYPHQFSGGMRQRIMLASVMLLRPALLVADEPTTALDAVVQREVLELLVELARENRTAVLMISHDLPMVARYCHRIIVMRQGEVVEQDAADRLLADPRHPYTRALLAAMPHRGPARVFPPGQRPIVAVRDLVVEYRGARGWFGRKAAKRALDGITLEVAPRQVVAVVGGSGSGKTTLGRALVGLVRPHAGAILFDGRPMSRSGIGFWSWRLNCQMVFQDPYSSLDPRMTVADLVGEPLRHATDLPRGSRADRVREVLDEVGLGDGLAARHPHQLSGGQRQRVAIARAIILRPRFLIADEPVSALDVTVRAQILALFAALQTQHGFSCLFISHDLGVVEQVADRVVVMNDGRIVEEGLRDDVFDAPADPYTRRLLSAVPTLDRTGTGGVRLAWRLDGSAQSRGGPDAGHDRLGVGAASA